MSQVEYYSLCYHAQLFKNEIYDPVKISQFWNREALRLDKFIAEHRDFYEYYKNGSADKDQLFFIRTNNNLDHSSDFDTEAKTVTSHDPLVSSLLALEKCNEYIQHELKFQ